VATSSLFDGNVNQSILISKSMGTNSRSEHDAVLRWLMDGDPAIQRSVNLRNPYVDPLNYHQIEMLRGLRTLSDPEGPEAERYREVIVLTVNGIAAGLRNTG